MPESRVADEVMKALKTSKPGWLSHLFHLEPAQLVACDAVQEHGEWRRSDSFVFLFRSDRGKYFVLHGVRDWRIVARDEAERLFRGLPVKLLPEAEALAPAEISPVKLSNEDWDDELRYAVLRNDKWEYSIWLDDMDRPSGWTDAGVHGSRAQCLEHINRMCVFGAPNPPSEPSSAP